MADFDTFASSLRSEFGEQGAGKKFEVFCKWFLENDPQWSAIVEEVWLWDEYPNKWQNQDLGTDLVFKDKDGSIWAVQAKFYSEHRSTTKSDMNSFLADTARASVDKRLWLQTTNKMDQTARKTLDGQDKPTTIFSLSDFRNSKTNYPSNFSELKQVQPLKKPLPDEHQVEAIDAVVAGLKKHDRGQLIMACGTGKTFTTLWVKEALKAESTLVLLPSLNLLSQTMREWAWGAKDKFQILNVCSDQSVGRLPEDMATSELSFPVTSDIPEIIDFLSKPGRKVLFCTYQSSPLIAAAQAEKMSTVFDLAIADEAHRCAGKIDAAFAAILDDNNIRCHKRLFTTATPKYFGKALKDAAKGRDIEIVDMDNELMFGPVVHELTFGEAIKRKLLNDYQVVVVGVDQQRAKELIDNQDIVQVAENIKTDARTLAAKLGFLKAINDFNLKRVISFHSRVKGARDFADWFFDVVNMIEERHRPSGKFFIEHVSGSMKTNERQEKIQLLNKLHGYDRGIVSNARCLAEGVDVPALDGIGFIDPKGSRIEIIQAVGRAIRKPRNVNHENIGTIIIPVFIGEDDEQGHKLEHSDFKPIWDVLNSLKAHDTQFSEILNEFRASLAIRKFGPQTNIPHVIFDLPESVSDEFAAAIRTELVEATTASWDFWVACLLEFKKKNGHVLVPERYKVESGQNLGTWVRNVRGEESKLSLDHKKQLDDLGFIWNVLQYQWERSFSALVQFKKEHDHLIVPVGFETKDGIKLYDWIGTQRRSDSNLSDENRKLLIEIGFVFDSVAQYWEHAFSLMKKYRDENQNCLVHRDHKTACGFALGAWVKKQRLFFSRGEGITKEQVTRLNEIGFIWNANDYKWEEGYKHLLEFVNEKKNCFISEKFVCDDGYNLGVWAKAQRVNKDSLSAERTQKLNAVNFIWDLEDYIWEIKFNELVKYKNAKGDCLVKLRFTTDNGINLGTWVQHLRRIKQTLSVSQIERLDELGFVWILE